MKLFIARGILAALSVIVLTPAGMSGEFPRIAWRFQLPEQYVPVDPVRAVDGTLYVMDLLGVLHAVDPSGQELWSVSGVGPQGLDIGPDGTLYAGNDFAVTAVNPDGTVKWTYPIDPIALVSYGPAVGPQGNIYFVGASISPVGQVLSLTPDGDLPLVDTMGIIPTVSFANPVFGLAPDGGTQFIFGANGVRRVDCDTGESNSVGGGGGMRVVTNLVGNIYFLGRGYDSASNVLFMGMGIIEAASLDGTVYAKGYSSLSRLDPEGGSTIWSFTDPQGPVGSGPISPNPDDTRMLYGGPGNAYQPPGELHYADTAGSFLWSLDLPVDDGRVSRMATKAIYTPDGSTAYFGSTTLYNGPTPNCYLYAIELEPPSATPGDVDGDGTVDFADLLSLLSAWGPCPGGCPPSCAADFDEDCIVAFNDLLILLANWG